MLYLLEVKFQIIHILYLKMLLCERIYLIYIWMNQYCFHHLPWESVSFSVFFDCGGEGQPKNLLRFPSKWALLEITLCREIIASIRNCTCVQTSSTRLLQETLFLFSHPVNVWILSLTIKTDKQILQIRLFLIVTWNNSTAKNCIVNYYYPKGT